MTHKKLFFTLMIAGQTAFASGYRLPENSVKSVGLSAAYIANASGADAAYYNPAAMVFNDDRQAANINMQYIHLTGIDFNGTQTLTGVGTLASNESSEPENFLIPSFHYVSAPIGNFRLGFSLVAPGGLSKRWQQVAKASSEEFTLETIELNPSVAYQVSEQFSLAAGIRAVYSKGIVKSSYAVASRDMDGDGWDYGHNFAFLYKPTDAVSVALTYRSRVNLKLEGNAKLTLGTTVLYNGYATVSVPLPAVVSLGVAIDVTPSTTVEIVYDQTQWSKYRQLDFNYNGTQAIFDTPITKNWTDTDAFRIGVTHQLDSQWQILAGYAYDQNPVPDATLGFELPDSDAHLFSIGTVYEMDDAMSVGISMLYSKKKSRSLTNAGLSGTFDNAAAYLVNAGIEYRF